MRTQPALQKGEKFDIGGEKLHRSRHGRSCRQWLDSGPSSQGLLPHKLSFWQQIVEKIEEGESGSVRITTAAVDRSKVEKTQ